MDEITIKETPEFMDRLFYVNLGDDTELLAFFANSPDEFFASALKSTHPFCLVAEAIRRGSPDGWQLHHIAVNVRRVATIRPYVVRDATQGVIDSMAGIPAGLDEMAKDAASLATEELHTVRKNAAADFLEPKRAAFLAILDAEIAAREANAPA